jgi:uncharacterized protein (DUF1330 family)
MTAYLVAQIDVSDRDAYRAYAEAALPVVEKYGGRFLVKAGPTIALEGDPPRERIVVIEFEDEESALTYYNSTEYQAAKSYREGAADAQFFIVSGAPPEPDVSV